jgi:predicted membrane chloride channel (bestrophin family)
MSLAAVTLSSTFVSFLLVFFFTQSYSRFWLQYEAAMGCKGRIFDAILLARTCMDLSSSMKLFRYMNAAHLLGYVGMGESYTATNFFFPINDIYHLLSESEVERIKAIGFKGGSAHREVIAWAVKVIKQQNLSRGISDHDSTTLMGEVFAFRARMAALYDFSEQPIPFSYIHFIKLIIFIYLPLFGFGVALNFSADKSGYWTESVFGFLLVLFFSMALIGTRELAQRLQDPLGHDMEDLSVLHYVTFNIEQSRRILLAEDSHALNDSAEIALSERRERNLSDEAFVVRTSSLESILGSLGKSSFLGAGTCLIHCSTQLYSIRCRTRPK